MQINKLYKDNEIITLDSYLMKCGVIDTKEYLHPYYNELDDPFNYCNMALGVEMFQKHLDNLSDTYIICDADLDGITSTVILYQYMKVLNKNWNIKILIHEGKERGLQDDIIFQHLKNEPRPFLIIPDAGTNDREQADKLLNVDILVLDHHDIETPIRHGILINNQANNFDFPTSISKNGSGCLVTWMFLNALGIRLNNNWANYLIDLVALSLVSDDMNMTDQQNRMFYHYGLETIDCVQNQFLRAVIKKFIGDNSYSQRDISFKIVPKFNSVIRTKNQELKYQIIQAFCGEIEIEPILDLCAECHKNQIETVANIIERHEKEISEISDNNLIVFSCDEMPRSYSGLVAAKISNICDGKPTIVGKDINGELLGSLRSPIPLRRDLDKNELVSWARGHEESCGVSIPIKNVQTLVNYYNTLELSYEPHIDVLQSYSIKSIPNYIYDVFDPSTDVLWGKGIPKPLFEVHDIIIYPNDIQVLGGNKRTLKISCNGLNILIFNATKQNKKDLGIEDIDNPKTEPIKLSCIGTLSINNYISKYGKVYTSNQMIIDKYEIHKIKTQKDVFKS